MTRFSLRDLFWLTLVVAMAVLGWGLHSRQQAETIKEESVYRFQLEQAIHREGYVVDGGFLGPMLVRQ